MSRRGFTLMELMIVVVLMGILSATMMPAFIATVEKSRAGEGLSNAASLAQDIDTYLTKGEVFTATTYMGKFLNMPGIKQSDDKKWNTPNFEYYPYCNTSACYIKVKRLAAENQQYGFIYTKTPKDGSYQNRSWTKKCYEFGSEVGHKICAGMEKGWSVSTSNF